MSQGQFKVVYVEVKVHLIFFIEMKITRKFLKNQLNNQINASREFLRQQLTKNVQDHKKKQFTEEQNKGALDDDEDNNITLAV